ncbi:MAG: hypothetical protein FWD01_02210 [Defluviitaleaceae bacterium]|nr:hypothetical protein [Defluviitaleaceae bacterium]
MDCHASLATTAMKLCRNDGQCCGLWIAALCYIMTSGGRAFSYIMHSNGDGGIYP